MTDRSRPEPTGEQAPTPLRQRSRYGHDNVALIKHTEDDVDRQQGAAISSGSFASEERKACALP